MTSEANPRPATSQILLLQLHCPLPVCSGAAKNISMILRDVCDRYIRQMLGLVLFLRSSLLSLISCQSAAIGLFVCTKLLSSISDVQLSIGEACNRMTILSRQACWMVVCESRWQRCGIAIPIMGEMWAVSTMTRGGIHLQRIVSLSACVRTHTHTHTNTHTHTHTLL